jgi:glyoxylase-like metal-dependent hydrolase (beta-lactamase superfamily II)
LEIAPNVYLVPGVIANAYLLVDPDGLTLIDAGLPNSAGRILGYLRSLGYRPGDLKRIIITHADMDHTGGLARLQKATQARVAAGAAEAEAIRAGEGSRSLSRNGILGAFMGALSMVMKPGPCQVDEILVDGQVLRILGGLAVLATPGHTPSHISLWQAQRKILFSGDSIVVRADHFEPYQTSTVWKPDLAVQSYRLQAALAPEIICGGHGWTDHDIPEKFERGNTAVKR